MRGHPVSAYAEGLVQTPCPGFPVDPGEWRLGLGLGLGNLGLGLDITDF